MGVEVAALAGQPDKVIRQMESAQANERRLDSDKARRIVQAMRTSVGRRGVAGSTFDHVAQEAGVSRGLLHYYFGTKERLLVEVVRHDTDVRMGRLEESLAAADSVDAIVESLVTQLKDYVGEDPASHALIYELFSVSRRNDEVREELAELYRRVRRQVAEVLLAKEREGVVKLRGNAESVASLLFALGDGLELQLVSDPSWDSGETFATGIETARFLLSG
jgi:AcrR family transcriptional regulator